MQQFNMLGVEKEDDGGEKFILLLKPLFGPFLDGPKVWTADQWKVWNFVYQPCGKVWWQLVFVRNALLAVARTGRTFYGSAGQQYTRESLAARGW